jgi:hypothetical protein
VGPSEVPETGNATADTGGEEEQSEEVTARTLWLEQVAEMQRRTDEIEVLLAQDREKQTGAQQVGDPQPEESAPREHGPGSTD